MVNLHRMDQPELHPCACGCGTPVKGTWVRGHANRGYANLAALPPPDLGVAEPEPELAHPAEDWQPGPEPGPAPPDDTGPAHARRDWHKKAAPPRKGSAKAPPRVTAGVRADIDAKLSFALEIPGRIWAARDPLCGGTFVEQRAEISAALTEIICTSSDLVAWFTGPGGQFMLWLNFAAAAWPVATVALAHHVYHSVGEGESGGAQQPDYTRYAA